MTNICLYFQIHQPYRLRQLNVFDVGKEAADYFTDGAVDSNGEVMKKVLNKSYLPMFLMLSNLTHEEEKFKFSISVSGLALEQIRKSSPELIHVMRKLADDGSLEFLTETYYHSLASLYSPTEFLFQVQKQKNMIFDLFGQVPKVFRNTELIFTNKIARMVKDMGFSGMLAEGADRVLRSRRPTRLYRAPGGLPLLLKHYQLSDDIAFRFSESARNGKPLTAETFCHWIMSNYSTDDTVNLFMDFETFGEHQWEDTGIFDFFYHFVKLFIRQGGNFLTVSEAIEERVPSDYYDSESPISWADVDRDITAWRGNCLQTDALKKIYALEKQVLGSENEDLIEDWRRLQTSDHYYYMCTKWSADGDVHAYFSPFKSPYFAYVNFGYALADINLRLRSAYG